MTISCDHVESLAGAYQHEALAPEVMEALRAHMERCPEDCRRFIAAYASDLSIRLMLFYAEQGTPPDLDWVLWYGAPERQHTAGS